jgi:hypothetical protein
MRFLQSPQFASTAKLMVVFFTGFGPAIPMVLNSIAASNIMIFAFIFVLVLF